MLNNILLFMPVIPEGAVRDPYYNILTDAGVTEPAEWELVEVSDTDDRGYFITLFPRGAPEKMIFKRTH